MRSLKVGCGPCSRSASARERARCVGLAVEGAALVRVLAVGQVALLAQDEAELLREAHAADVLEVGGHLAVVGGHARRRPWRPGAGGPRPRRGPCWRSSSTRSVVVGRVADGGHAAEVAGRGGQEREAADVDQSRRPRRWARPRPTCGAKGRSARRRRCRCGRGRARPGRPCPPGRDGAPGCRRRRPGGTSGPGRRRRAGPPVSSVTGRAATPASASTARVPSVAHDLDAQVEQLARQLRDAGPDPRPRAGLALGPLLPRETCARATAGAGHRVYQRPRGDRVAPAGRR